MLLAAMSCHWDGGWSNVTADHTDHLLDGHGSRGAVGFNASEPRARDTSLHWCRSIERCTRT